MIYVYIVNKVEEVAITYQNGLGHPVFSIGNGSVNIPNGSIEAKRKNLGFWNAFSSLTFSTLIPEDFSKFEQLAFNPQSIYHSLDKSFVNDE